MKQQTSFSFLFFIIFLTFVFLVIVRVSKPQTIEWWHNMCGSCCGESEGSWGYNWGCWVWLSRYKDVVNMCVAQLTKRSKDSNLSPPQCRTKKTSIEMCFSFYLSYWIQISQIKFYLLGIKSMNGYPFQLHNI